MAKIIQNIIHTFFICFFKDTEIIENFGSRNEFCCLVFMDNMRLKSRKNCQNKQITKMERKIIHSYRIKSLYKVAPCIKIY